MKYALLIDSENAEPRLDEIFQELSKYGDTPIRYLVGNFTKSSTSTTWIKACQKHAITCIQTINFTQGKNSLDISLVIEGMKILYEKSFIDGVIIIASDSDYTPLAREWRNAGKDVIGIGRKLTPESYRASCTQFIYVENIYNKKDDVVIEDDTTESVSIEKINALMHSILNENNGSAQLSVVVETIRKAYTDFDVRNYGYQKARDFFAKSFKDIKVTEERKNIFFISSITEEKKKPAKLPKPLAEKKEEKASTEKNVDELFDAMVDKYLKPKQPAKKKRSKIAPKKEKKDIVVKTIVEDELNLD